jgi:hypothetical protein
VERRKERRVVTDDGAIIPNLDRLGYVDCPKNQPVLVSELGYPPSVAVVVELDVDAFAIRKAGNFTGSMKYLGHASF